MSIDLCLSLLFHPGEADDIQALQHMRTMGRVTKDDDVVGTGVEQQLMCIMRAMPIHEEDMCATFGLVFCLCLKVNLNPATGEVVICPPITICLD